jgi:hypothetical protein
VTGAPRSGRGWAWIAGVAGFALALRLIVLGVPGVAERIPVRPYSRAIHYQVAAEAIRSGEPAHLDTGRRDRILEAWRAADTFLPPDAASVPPSPADARIGFYDERGYLLLTLAMAGVTGRVAYFDLLLAQALVSAAAIGLVSHATRLAAGLAPAVAVGLVLALHPLDLVLVAMPDVPMWAVAATAVAAAMVLQGPTRPSPASLAVRVVGGVFIGFAVVLRAPTLAVAAALLIALPIVRGRRGLVEAAAVAVGVAVGVVGPALAPLDLPPVGRSEFWHTLLGGLAETGRVPGLAWEDTSIDAYVGARHGVTLGDPGFSQAAKHEYFALLADDPALPARVTAERLWNFLIGYRPGKESWPYLVAIGLTKLAGLGGWAVWMGWARDEDRRRAIAVGLVVLAPLLAHALIVPLLEVYVAASLIGMLALGAGVLGALPRAAPPPPRSP